MSDTAGTVRRRVRNVCVSADPPNNRLLLDYELEASVFDERDQLVISATKALQTTINVHSFSSKTNVRKFSRLIVDSTSILNASRLEDVASALKLLQMSNNQYRPSALHSDTSSKTAAAWTNLSVYIEGLYEPLSEQISAARHILELASNSLLLDAFTEHETLMEVLSRTLREKWKDSLELTAILVGIFHCLALYDKFHSVLVRYKIGLVCMDMLTHFYTPAKTPNYFKGISISDKSDIYSLHFNCFLRLKMQCMTILSYLAADADTVEKMIRRDIAHLLVQALSHESAATLPEGCCDLRPKLLDFLCRLSVCREPVERMATVGIWALLPALLASSDVSTQYQSKCLTLVYNLSFSPAHVRLALDSPQFLNTLKHFLSSKKSLHALCLGVLYNISFVDNARHLITQLGCVPLVISIFINSTDSSSCHELYAFLVSMTMDRHVCVVVCESGVFETILERASAQKDAFLMRVVANVSQHCADIQPLSTDRLHALTQLIVSGHGQMFTCYCVVATANFLRNGSYLNAISLDASILLWVKSCLEIEDMTGGREKLFFASLQLLSVLCRRCEFCALFLEEQILLRLLDISYVHISDHALTLSTIHIFYCSHTHQSLRDRVAYIPGFIDFLLACSKINNEQIYNLSLKLLNHIKTIDAHLEKTIVEASFMTYNWRWVRSLSSPTRSPATAPFEALCWRQAGQHSYLIADSSSVHDTSTSHS